MFILWILLVLGVGWALLTVLQERGSLPFSSDVRRSPLEVLQRRYAKGELTTEEYEERKERLERDQ